MPVLSREEAVERVTLIEGWLTPREADLLYGMAHNSPGPVVEIGSFMGRSTTALALGSMAGRKQPVWAIDPFLGVPESDRKTDLGTVPATIQTGPQRLRANLDAAGVNGLVNIVPKASQDALPDVPEDIGLLFVDGAHDYESVKRDIDNYLPRVRMGGFVVFHDTSGGDPDVNRAVEDHLGRHPQEWRMLELVDSALVVRRVNTEKRMVRLMCPGSSFKWGAVSGIVQCTMGAHRVDLDNNGNGFDDFNAMWARALNEYELGHITHVAMLHADIAPQTGWIDILMDELAETDADLISVACSMKDERALCNCGIADAERWRAFRRFAVKELRSLPATFDISHTQHPDKILLHNTGCWVADLRKPVFWQTYEDDGISPGEFHWHEKGDLRAWFDFPTRVRKHKGKWINDRESEDWFWSRQLAKLGAKTFITRKIRLGHIGDAVFLNVGDWGEQTCDEAGRTLWEPEVIARGLTPPARKEAK